MTSDPGSAVEQWSQQLRDKQAPPELVRFIEREYPEALEAAAARGMTLRPTGVLDSGFSAPFLRKNKVFHLYFGWSAGFSFETWSCAAALGPGGLLRVSQRPQALSQILCDDSPALTPADAEPLAALLAAALVPESPPDSAELGFTGREARHRSTLLTPFRLMQIDEPGAYLVPVDPGAWRAARPSINAPSLELVPGGGVATFFYLDSRGTLVDGQSVLFRLLRFRCPMQAGSYAIQSQVDELGPLWLRVPPQAVPGRALLVGGAPRRPPLARSGAWARWA